MASSAVEVGGGLAVALAVLTLVAAGCAALARLGVARQVLTAAVRAVVQLGAVSAVIVAVVRSLWLASAFVLVMFAVATWTSARRMRGGAGAPLTGLPIAAGTLPVLAVVLGCGAVPLTGIAIVPVAGIGRGTSGRAGQASLGR